MGPFRVPLRAGPHNARRRTSGKTCFDDKLAASAFHVPCPSFAVKGGNEEFNSARLAGVRLIFERALSIL